MPNIGNIIDQVRNGIVDVSNILNGVSAISDNRATNDIRPRVSPADPASQIDTPKTLGVLSFPEDRPKYYISFGFQDYQRPSVFEGLSGDSINDYLCLPIPNNLKDSNRLIYKEDNSNFLIEAITPSLRYMAKDGLTGAIDSTKIGNLIHNAGKAIAGDSIQKAANLIESASSDLGQAGVGTGIEQLLGIADNPFLTIKFGGPEFKTHSFSWRLSPRNASESQTLYKIINLLKGAAYPELLDTTYGGFYKYPKIVWPKFNPDVTREYMYKFKPCVITNLDIDWSPNDRPAFHYDGTANEIVLYLQLQEIELWRNTNGGFFDISDGDYVISSTTNGTDLGVI